MSPTPAVVTLRERGSTAIDPMTWARLSNQPEFWELVESGIVLVTKPKRGSINLRGTRFVGSAQVGDVRIEVHEKVSGALSALLQHALPEAFRLQPIAGASTELNALTALLVHAFVTAVRRYVSQGREFVYATAPATGGVLTGRLDVVGTVHLRSRGMGHLVAYHKATVSHDVEPNRVILRALREVEAISRLTPIQPRDLVASRTLAMLFDESRDTEVLFGDRRTWGQRAEAAAQSSDRTSRYSLLQLARSVIGHESIGSGWQRSRNAPYSWFLDLEVLFEDAIRNASASALDGMAQVTSGKEKLWPIFDSSKRRYRADPDLIVSMGSTPALIGDVKYKEWTGKTVQQDVYQILVHAATYSVSKCFLVYPGERFEHISIGTTAFGVGLDIFVIDVLQLANHCAEMARILGVVS